MRSHRHDPAVGLPASGVGGLSRKLVRTGPGTTHSNAPKVPEVQSDFARRKAREACAATSPSWRHEGNPGLFTCADGHLGSRVRLDVLWRWHR